MEDNKWHNAKYRGIPCWYRFEMDENYEDGGELIAKNWFYEILLDINIWWDVNIIKIDYFPLLIEEDE